MRLDFTDLFGVWWCRYDSLVFRMNFNGETIFAKTFGISGSNIEQGLAIAIAPESNGSFHFLLLLANEKLI